MTDLLELTRAQRVERRRAELREADDAADGATRDKPGRATIRSRRETVQPEASLAAASVRSGASLAGFSEEGSLPEAPGSVGQRS